MKIAVVGCGALGSFYGAKLACSGLEVHFLLRSDYETVKREGVFIRSVKGDFRVHPRCAREPVDSGESDLVVIGLKTIANNQLGKLLPPLVGPNTLVLTLQNGLWNDKQLAELFGPGNILGCLCFVCLNRVQPGVIEHLAHVKIVLGEFGRPPAERTQELAALFQQSGVPCEVTDNLARAHWEKLMWNIPFNGLGVAGAAGYRAVGRGEMDPSMPLGNGLTTDQLLADLKCEGLVRELMQEVMATARALGFQIPESLAEKQIDRTREMKAYKASTLVDFERGQPLEWESLFLRPLQVAQRAGVAVPRLSALCEVLRQLDPKETVSH
jgi:2-dehydropantoate 2-reductase